MSTSYQQRKRIGARKKEKVAHTFSDAIVGATSSPRTSLRKTLLNERSIMRESSIAFATNWPITRKI